MNQTIWSDHQRFAWQIIRLYLAGFLSTVIVAILIYDEVPLRLLAIGPAFQGVLFAWRGYVWASGDVIASPTRAKPIVKLVIVVNVVVMCSWVASLLPHVTHANQTVLIIYTLLFCMNMVVGGSFSRWLVKYSILSTFLVLAVFLLMTMQPAALTIFLIFASTSYLSFSLSENIEQIFLKLDDMNAKMESEKKRALHLANHDQLTGIKNRANFWHMLNKMASQPGSRQKTTIMLLDLDGFKGINDAHGHSAGDAVLIEAAKRISALVERMPTRGHTVRLGGDEFGILLTAPTTLAQAQRLAQEIVQDLEVAIHWCGINIRISTSVGIHQFVGGTETPEQIVEKADHALYGAKRQPGGHIAVFSQRLEAEIAMKSKFRQKLREAIRNGEIDVVFQPVIRCRTGEIFYYEALARWHDEDFGQVQPLTFVMAAQEMGLANELFGIVLDKAIHSVNQLQAGTAISVNLAPTQLDDSLFGWIGPILASHSFDPKRLYLEMTELTLIENPEATRATIGRLKDQGIGVVLDDFGAGYASLSVIDQFDFAVVKLDRSLMSEIIQSDSRKAIFRTVLELCKTLGIPCVAEGIESEAMLNYTIDSGCELAQGYFINLPESPTRFAAVTDYAYLVNAQHQPVSRPIRVAG